jgi:hypothetical protein
MLGRETPPPRDPIADPSFMKNAAKYVSTLLAFIVAAYVLSWLSVFSFWIGARVFHSVFAVRAGETIGSFILAPVRMLYWLMGDLVDQSAPLYDPKSYARINAALLGILAYSICRRWIFPGSKRRNS